MFFMQEMKSYKAIVVDDHRMFAESFCDLLKKMADFGIVDQCNTIEKAQQKMLVQEYDYLFSDLLMPGSDAMDFIKKCRKLNENLIIIVISSTMDLSTIKELFGAGINSFLSKAAGTNEVKTAIDAARIGEKYISTELAGKMAVAVSTEKQTNLTKKEIEVLRLVAKGLTIAEAADKLFLSPHTIVGHRRNIMQKLGIRSATEMVKYAFENNLL
jgi:DNA-binding NarL/FixJ family response regulator